MSKETKPKQNHLGRRRLFGIDRSGPSPEQTQPGEPLRPWTLPNLVGYLRLAAIPVFLVLALSGEDGPPLYAAAIFWLIAAGDYLDGFLARATGQYSRLGSLLDPVVDRATILAGGYVCWHFELLPRWALAAIAVREVLTLLMAQVALRKGVPIEINWFGRIAVFPIMSAIFFSMVVVSVAWDIMLVLGLVLAVFASVVYVRDYFRGTSSGKGASKPSTSD